MIRIAPVMLTMVLVSACDGSLFESADPSSYEPVEVIAKAKDVPVLLRGDGLQINNDAQGAFAFSSDEQSVRSALDEALGAPKDVFEQPACEPGTLTLVSYAGNLTVNFMDGQFVGWVLQGGGEPRLATPEDVTIDTPLESLGETYTVLRTGMSPLGAEYSAMEGYTFSVADAGEGQAVMTMDAGAVCFR